MVAFRKIISLILICLIIILISSCRSNTTGLEFINQQAISAGPFQIVGLNKDGTVMSFVDPSLYKDSWGDACIGEYDVSSWSDVVSVAAGGDYEFGYFFAAGLKYDGTVVFTDNCLTDEDGINENIIKKWENIVQISAGTKFIAGLKNDGTVVCTDESGSGLNSIYNWNDIVAISAGSQLVGLKKDGTVVETAFTNDGDESFLGDYSSWEGIVSVAAGSGNTIGLKKDGTVVATGWREYRFDPVYEWENIIKICNNGNYAIAIKNDGSIVSTTISPDISSWKDISDITACADIIAGLNNDGTIVVYGLEGDFSSWVDIGLPLNIE